MPYRFAIADEDSGHLYCVYCEADAADLARSLAAGRVDIDRPSASDRPHRRRPAMPSPEW